MMNWETLFVFSLIILAVYSFVTERLSSDQTAIGVFVALLLGSLLPFSKTLPKADDMLAVFANPAPITIAAMFIVSSALQKCGAIDSLAASLGSIATLGYRRFLFTMVLSVAVVSAFTNNTPVVVVFLPIVLSLSRMLSVPSSKLLIPLSYASIFGGTCTLVGTSTNILASGILQSAGHRPISMFELSSIGVPLLLIGTLYLVLFASRLLPHRETLTSILSEDERREYITEAFLRKGSEIVGKTVSETDILKSPSVRVLEIIRNSIALSGNPQKTVLAEGDRLVLACRPSGFAHTRSLNGIDLTSEIGLGLQTIAAHEGSIVEGVIGPKSTIAGEKILDLHFRQRYRMILLAVHRGGINVREHLDQLILHFGDTLLMMGTDSAIEDMRKSEDILLLDRPATPARSTRKKMPIVLTVMAAIIILVSLNVVPIVAAVLIACGILFLTGCIEPKEGYAAIDWSILFLIYGMLGLGMAMESTGTAGLVAAGLIEITEFAFTDSLRPYIVLAALYLCTAIFTELLSNNATIVLMAPIALGLASTLQVDPRPFVIACAVASSASFSTPIGYQTNTYVYGVGGYRFRDFYKIGVPLNLLYFSFSVALIPRIWAF